MIAEPKPVGINPSGSGIKCYPNASYEIRRHDCIFSMGFSFVSFGIAGTVHHRALVKDGATQNQRVFSYHFLGRGNRMGKWHGK